MSLAHTAIDRAHFSRELMDDTENATGVSFVKISSFFMFHLFFIFSVSFLNIFSKVASFEFVDSLCCSRVSFTAF